MGCALEQESALPSGEALPSREHRLSLGVLLMLLTALVACAPRPRTQVTVRIEADDVIGPQIDHVQVRVLGGRTGADLLLASEETPAFDFADGLQVAVVPLGGDTSRFFEVEATAMRGAESLAVVRIISRFQPRELVTRVLRFEACCIGRMCGSSETCRACACQPATDELPDAGMPDAPVLMSDAGQPPTDAWTPRIDAFVPPDAFIDICPSSNCTRVPLLSNLGISPNRGAVFARPVGTSCPATSLSTPDFGVGSHYLYNESARAQTLRLTTQRFDTATSYDPTLIVYDVDRVGSSVPLSPLACTQLSEDAVGLDAQVTITLAPMQFTQVVLTGALRGPLAAEMQIRVEQL